MVSALAGSLSETRGTGSCRECGTSYIRRNVGRVYCTKSCCGAAWKRRHRRLEYRSCKQCLAEFRASVTGRELFCDKRCRLRFHSSAYYWRNRKGPIRRQCRNCHRVFRRGQHHRLFCSGVCCRRWHGREFYDRHIRKPNVTKRCVHCGDPFVTHMQIRRYCGRKCMQRHWYWRLKALKIREAA
jgi:hypothetical protein